MVKIKSYDHVSRKNFGNSESSDRGESHFLEKFEHAFHNKVKIGTLIDEFAVPQHGVADILWMGWNLSESVDANASTLIRALKRRHLYAFEGKLKDWKKALHQAYRYRYYADKSIVVMPLQNANAALKNLDCFISSQVGFWTYCTETERIREWYTPTRVKALSQRSRDLAVKKISLKLDLC